MRGTNSVVLGSETVVCSSPRTVTTFKCSLPCQRCSTTYRPLLLSKHAKRRASTQAPLPGLVRVTSGATIACLDHPIITFGSWRLPIITRSRRNWDADWPQAHGQLTSRKVSLGNLANCFEARFRSQVCSSLAYCGHLAVCGPLAVCCG